jgi:hypothetical protein
MEAPVQELHLSSEVQLEVEIQVEVDQQVGLRFSVPAEVVQDQV